MTKRLSNVDIIAAQDVYCFDQFKWHDAMGHFTKVADMNTWKAGHADGWRDAIKYLKLHGALVTIK